jgi:hypothetical protein
VAATIYGWGPQGGVIVAAMMAVACAILVAYVGYAAFDTSSTAGERWATLVVRAFAEPFAAVLIACQGLLLILFFVQLWRARRLLRKQALRSGQGITPDMAR